MRCDVLQRGDWLDERTLIADIWQGQVRIVTMIGDQTREDAVRQADLIVRIRRHRCDQEAARRRAGGPVASWRLTPVEEIGYDGD